MLETWEIVAFHFVVLLLLGFLFAAAWAVRLRVAEWLNEEMSGLT